MVNFATPPPQLELVIGEHTEKAGGENRESLQEIVWCRKSNTTFNVNPIDKIELDETCSTTSHGNWESTMDMYLKFEIARIIEYMRFHHDDRLTGYVIA